MSSDPFDTAYLQRNVGRLAARGGIILALGQGIQLLLSVASTIVLARLLAPEDFGLVAMVAPFIGFLAFFRDSGLQMATVQRETIHHAQVSTLFWLNLGLGFVLMLLLAAASPAIARFFARGELTWITLAYALNMVIGGASIQHAALLSRRMAFAKLSIAAIAGQVIGLAAAVTGALLGLRYGALVAMAIAATLVQTVLLWHLSGWTPGLPRRGTGASSMLLFGSGLTLSNVLNQVTQYLDGILIGRMLGAVPLGYYDRAKQLFVMPIFQLVGPLANVSIPALSRLTSAPARYAAAYLRIQEKLLLATALFSAFFVAYGDVVIRVLLGAAWSPVAPVLQAFAIGGFVGPASVSLSWLLVTQGRSRDLALWSPCSLALRCAAIAVGYRWGIVGIALSIAASQYVAFFAFALWVGRKGAVGSGMVLRNMVPPLASAVASGTLAFVTKRALSDAAPLVSLGAGALVASVVFLCILWSMPAGKSALRDLWNLGKAAMAGARYAG